MEFRRQFTHAIVRGIPDSMALAAEGLHGKIDLAKAREQHRAYVDTLRAAGLSVTSLPADEKYADCVFTEDAAVIVGDHALVTNPGVASRKGETGRMREILESLGLIVMDIKDPDACIDGGDVIFTGKELLCGLSKRTNKKGMRALASAFPGLTVVPVTVTGPLHLTTSIGLAYEDTLCVSTETPASGEMLASIRANSEVDYKVIYVAEDNAANCIWINDTLICRGGTRGHNVLSACRPGGNSQDVVGLDISEIEKAVGSLTCMSLRFRPMGMLRQSGQTTKKNGFTTLAPSQTSLSNGYKDVKVVLNGSPETNPKIKGF